MSCTINEREHYTSQMQEGMPLEDIAKFTGLSVADIQQFLQG